MRRSTGIAITLAVASLALGGCAALDGAGASGVSGSGDGATTEQGRSWIQVEQGKATPSPSAATSRAAAPTPSVWTSMPTPDPGCTRLWPRTDARVFIPVDVTVGTGSVKVEWPRQYGSNYRVAAVPQRLVSGPQPEPSWKAVPAGTGCVMTTTITGLTSGEPYILWLDAPNTGREQDGTRHLYAGRSGVVIPK